jgi:hypothetical protein
MVTLACQPTREHNELGLLGVCGLLGGGLSFFGALALLVVLLVVCLLLVALLLLFCALLLLGRPSFFYRALARSGSRAAIRVALQFLLQRDTVEVR